MNYGIHPAANEFPMMDVARMRDLVADISANGLRVPITLCDGAILDGRNRYAACQELGIEPRFDEYVGDPYAYVWSLNGSRRDLVNEQRSLIWLSCNEKSEAWQAEQRRIRDEANAKRSEAQKGVPKAEIHERAATDSGTTLPERTSAAKAKAAGTDRGSMERAESLRRARPDLAEQVAQNTMKPAEAHRQMKKDAVAQRVTELPADRFTVLYADPPWKYNDKRSGKDATGATDHYPTMALSELSVLDIPSLAADDSVLFLWATSPLLPDALALAKAWGFSYKASFVWDKVKHNMGHYNSVRHEFLLICTRGSCTPQQVTLFDSVVSIERTEHSRKPERFREIIDALYPNGNRIELFCRGAAPANWTVWGHESVAA